MSEIQILAETDSYIVINKPALLDSQNSKEGRPSVAQWLKQKFDFAGLVHRLDFGTSGAMICAKDSESARKLTNALQNGKIKRTYLAVTLGTGLENQGTFESLLDDKIAITHYKVLECFRNSTLIEATLETGRKHQIRRQFSEKGFPLLGDHLYGKRGAKLLFNRPALHASKLSFEERAFEAPLPQDLRDLILRLRKISL